MKKAVKGEIHTSASRRSEAYFCPLAHSGRVKNFSEVSRSTLTEQSLQQKAINVLKTLIREKERLKELTKEIIIAIEKRSQHSLDKI